MTRNEPLAMMPIRSPKMSASSIECVVSTIARPFLLACSACFLAEISVSHPENHLVSLPKEIFTGSKHPKRINLILITEALLAWKAVFLFQPKYITQVTLKIIYLYCRKKIVGSKHPQNVVYDFDSKITAVEKWCVFRFASQHALDLLVTTFFCLLSKAIYPKKY